MGSQVIQAFAGAKSGQGRMHFLGIQDGNPFASATVPWFELGPGGDGRMKLCNCALAMDVQGLVSIWQFFFTTSKELFGWIILDVSFAGASSDTDCLWQSYDVLRIHAHTHSLCGARSGNPTFFDCMTAIFIHTRTQLVIRQWQERAAVFFGEPFRYCPWAFQASEFVMANLTISFWVQLKTALETN